MMESNFISFNHEIMPSMSKTGSEKMRNSGHRSNTDLFLGFAMTILSLALFSSSCARDRGKSETDDERNGDDASDNRSNRKTDGSEESHNDAADRGDEEKDGSIDPDDPRDAGDEDTSENQRGMDASNSGNNDRDSQIRSYSGEDADNSGIGGQSQPSVPYENLQQIPNSSARICPGSSYQSIAVSMFPPCEDICPNAHCVDNSMVIMMSDADAVINSFYPCGESAVCIPDGIIGTIGHIQSKKCRSIGNTEGVCTTACKKVNSTTLNPRYLPQDSCYEHEVCIPCYDPIAGGLTAFNPCGNYVPATCNPGATEHGIVFDKCCDGNGTCYPGLEDINPQVAALLGRDSCSGNNELCLPRLFGLSIFRPAICETSAGEEGRCLPNCISSTLIEQYSQQDCAANETCVPCSRGACVFDEDQDEPEDNIS